MKVIVPVKRVIDYNVKVRVKADGSGVDLANVKMSMNPFDEIAVEEAIRLREAGKAEEVVEASVLLHQHNHVLHLSQQRGQCEPRQTPTHESAFCLSRCALGTRALSSPY